MKRFPASCVVVGFGLAALSVAASSAAQAPAPINEGDVSTVTATVEAIDSGNRLLTLRGEKGEVTTIRVPDSVERFSAIKVGDKVTARYVESVAVQVRRPGEAKAPPVSAEAAVVRRPGEKPGATISQQYDARVKVETIDTKTPSLAVKTADGNTLSFRVQDPKKLEGLKVGDEIEVTYTEALMITVDPPKK